MQELLRNLGLTASCLRTRNVLVRSIRRDSKVELTSIRGHQVEPIGRSSVITAGLFVSAWRFRGVSAKGALILLSRSALKF